MLCPWYGVLVEDRGMQDCALSMAITSCIPLLNGHPTLPFSCLLQQSFLNWNPRVSSITILSCLDTLYRRCSKMTSRNPWTPAALLSGSGSAINTIQPLPIIHKAEAVRLH